MTKPLPSPLNGTSETEFVGGGNDRWLVSDVTHARWIGTVVGIGYRFGP